MGLNDKKHCTLNAKAMNVIYCALDRSEFNRVCDCEIVQEIWHRLEVTHEGMSQVKESKLAILNNQYESFRIRQGKQNNSSNSDDPTICYKCRKHGYIK